MPDKHLVRIGPAWLRVPLLCLWFPWSYLHFVLFCAIPHPNKRRLLEADFWLFPVQVFHASCDGEFVPR